MPPSSALRVDDISRALKDGSITATAIGNFGGCDGPRKIDGILGLRAGEFVVMDSHGTPEVFHRAAGVVIRSLEQGEGLLAHELRFTERDRSLLLDAHGSEQLERATARLLQEGST